MKIEKNVKRARFIRRPDRFRAYVELEGEEVLVHVPNTGRCREILVPGTTVILREENNPLRKTPYDLIAGYKGDVLISIDSHIPNKVVEEALKEGWIHKLKNYTKIEREKTFGSSRFDFRLSRGEQEYYLEVKGVTYEENGLARFPDAPTERGARHLMELIDAKKSGRGAGVIFLIQLSGVTKFSPHDVMDEKFGAALRKAYSSGVDVFAYDCIVSEASITLNKEIEVKL